MLNSYIDESGDDGLNCINTKVHVISALLVKEEDDLEVSTTIPRIKSRLNWDKNKAISWYNLKREKRLVVVEEIKKNTKITFFNSIIFKDLLNIGKWERKFQLYHYSIKLLLERVSWYARDHDNQKVHCIFQKIEQLNYSELFDYIDLCMRYKNFCNNIDIYNSEVTPNRLNKNIQIICNFSSLVRDAFEFSSYETVDPFYLIELLPLLYRSENKKLLSYGLKFFPSNWNKFKEYKWLNEYIK